MTDLLKIVIPLVVTTVIALAGWIVVHRLNAERDLKNSRLQLRTQYLLEIYRKLERSCGKAVTRESADDIEVALADLQLLGSAEQVHMARQYIAAHGNRNLTGINVGLLMEDIRNNLRIELGLEPIKEPVDHLRLHLASEDSHNANASDAN
jgi:hypothetical protein